MNPLTMINALKGGQRVKDVNILRMAAAAADAETITIGGQTFEVSLLETEGDITSGNIEINLFDDAVQAQGTLTMATKPTADDTVTIGSTVYTFKASQSAAGEVEIGADVAASKVNLVAAINGTDGVNSADPLVTAADFAGDDMVVTAIKAGTTGNAIASEETFTDGSDAWDAATLGTTQAGADPTAEEFIDGALTVINSNSTVVTAVKISAAIMAIYSRQDGKKSIACTETLAGTNNVWAAATTFGGRQVLPGAIKRSAMDSRVPTATEVAVGVMVFAFPFDVDSAMVQAKVTATNALKAIDGDVALSNNLVIVNNDGSTDWATTDTVTVLAQE